MRRMTVWKSCHGVCNLEACFFGGDLHGWWKLRALPTKTGGDFRASPTKTGILTCLTLLMRNPAGEISTVLGPRRTQPFRVRSQKQSQGDYHRL